MSYLTINQTNREIFEQKFVGRKMVVDEKQEIGFRVAKICASYMKKGKEENTFPNLEFCLSFLKSKF